MAVTVPMADMRRQVQSIRSELDEAVGRVLTSGWFVLGPEVEQFEHEFASYCGVRHAIGVASGAEALYLALAALGVGRGDEVVTVANACTYQFAAITQCGATPVFADVDGARHVVSPDAIEAAVTSRTKAIMPVHLYGALAPMHEVREVASRLGLAVVEDAAQAHGAWRRDPIDGTRRRAGSWGDAGCFSFYPSKNLGALGDGGAITTDDDTLADRIRRLRMYGWSSKYAFAEAGGRNSRLDELQAAVLRVKLRHLDRWNDARRERAEWYRELIDVDDLAHPVADEGHVYHLYAVTCPWRDELREWLRQQGIATDVHYPIPMHLQAPVWGASRNVQDLPATEQLANAVCSLPMFPELTRAEVEHVAAAIVRVAGSRRKASRRQSA